MVFSLLNSYKLKYKYKNIFIVKLKKKDKEALEIVLE